MAITKILARKGRLDVGIRYVLNGDKTQEQILTARLNCDPGHECRQMLETKRAVGKEGGVQYYHLIQSFQPGEVTPELALEIAREFAEEHLPGYQTVIGIHVDKEHIHAHILFNSVNADTGEKYHSNAQSYYRQIRVISDRLCRERGLSVLLQGKPTQAVSYIEWLRRSRGQPTFRSMLEEDLRTAIADANDLGHFFLLMEHMGYEISHGNRLGFRLRGQERFMIPGRKNPLFTEDGIRAAIQGNLAAMSRRTNGRFLRIRTKPLLTSRPLTLCRKSVGMSDATRTAGAKQLPSQACFIVPIAAARCMSTVPTTASVFLNIPVPNTAKSQLESSARHNTVSMKMWYCPLFPKCSKPLPNMQSMTEPSLSEWYRKRSPASRQQRLRNSGHALPPQSRECPSWKSCSAKSMRTTF